jgi:hypothetical protein
MNRAEFCLVLQSESGWNATSIAGFVAEADLWLFWRAWREAVSTDSRASARFVHNGRSVRYVRPPETEAAWFALVADYRQRDVSQRA